ncbi:peptidoglycan DD-metalloendopeptidase family protein [Bacillus sp. FJAT-29814]|uniref:peptidoglycan DD-metalloendopeptidase family protein n=1 Tax=Bacillus sp. FJAT-29814 TaxID=1729688 RepID=UPI000829AC04|nr:M23 family metallopeptidase [Bacillus sp. FJAT-29814]
MFFLNRNSNTKRLLMLKTTVAATVAASIIAFSSGPVALADSSKLTTIYHVYVNGTYIGNVNDKEVVDKVVAEKIGTMKELLKHRNLKLGSQVQYIPEQVFRSTGNNNETIQNFKNTFQIHAEAAALFIDGKPVAFLETKADVEEVIRQMKLQYVPEDQLQALEARQALPETELPPLKENETRLLDVRLSKNVSIEEQNVEIEKLMSPEQAVTFLRNGSIEEKKYVVQAGDVLETIAHRNGMNLADIIGLNPGLTADSLLQIGQEINITATQPFVEVIVEKEANQVEAIPYSKEVTEDASIPKGQTIEKQQGQNGSRSVTYLISEQNGVTVKKDQTSEQILQQPVKNIVIKGTKAIPSRGDGSLAWPAVGGYISSQMGPRWGRMHKGIDIARPSDKTIKAADNGVVVSAGWDSGGYGNKVIIDHQNGLRTLYAHMSSLNVTAGQTVSKGQAIGIMGATGNVTGVHLHFEVFKNGGQVDPMNYLNR